MWACYSRITVLSEELNVESIKLPLRSTNSSLIVISPLGKPSIKYGAHSSIINSVSWIVALTLLPSGEIFVLTR